MRVNLSVGPFLINRPVKILCTNLARSCLYEQSWWQRNRPSPKCSLKVGSIARRRSVICHSREHFHWWPCLTPLHPTLSMVLSDVRLGCNCSAMETTPLSMLSWANVKATWSLGVCSNWLCSNLATSVHYTPHDSLTPLCDFTWSTLSGNIRETLTQTQPQTVECGKEISGVDLFYK